MINRMILIKTNINAIGGLNYQLPIKGLSLDLQYAINYLNAQNKNFNGQEFQTTYQVQPAIRQIR